MGFPRPEYWSGLAISSSRRSSQLRDWTCVSCIDRQTLYHWATRETCKFGTLRESKKGPTCPGGVREGCPAALMLRTTERQGAGRQGREDRVYGRKSPGKKDLHVQHTLDQKSAEGHPGQRWENMIKSPPWTPGDWPASLWPWQSQSHSNARSCLRWQQDQSVDVFDHCLLPNGPEGR